MTKRILPAVFLGLAIASRAVLAQDVGTTPTDDAAQTQQQKQEDQYWNGLNPNYHNDDSPNYPFSA